MKSNLFFALVILITACGSYSSGSKNKEITVSAAVSLKDAFNEIGSEYLAETGTKIAFNFGSSGNLQRQIESGAPADVFASAGESQMNALAEKGLINANSRKDFASNRIVLIVPSGSKIEITAFEGLKNNDVKKIAIGNPKTVPAGQYTQQMFDALDLSETLKPKLVYAESVRQVLEYVIRGEVDAGVVYSTDAVIGRDKVVVKALAPEDSHQPIVYPIAVVKDSKNPAAPAFIDFVMSKKGQAILQKYGFIPPLK